MFESLMVVREALKHLPINFFYIDRAGYIRHCNPEVNKYFDINDDSIIGKHCIDLNVEAPWQNSIKVMDYKQTMIFEEECINPEKKINKFFTIKCPIYNSEKKVIGISGISLDTAYTSPQFLFRNINTNSNALTDKQSECLQYLIAGKTAKEIAKILQVSYRTIEHRIAALKRKFSCNKISELIYKATCNKSLV